MNTTPLEADTRYLIDKSLENLGWSLKGKHQNVFFEQPKTESEKKKLGGKRPDYVLYSSDVNAGDKPLIIIEAKKKGERLDTALEQGIHYAKQLEAPIVFATDGLFCKSYHTKFERTPILNGEEVDEFLRETLALKYLASWEVNTVSPKVQYDRKELIRIFDEANNMLRGDGLRAGIERFGEFANILFLKLISETEQIKKESGIQSAFDSGCHWNAIKDIPVSRQIDYINGVYKTLNGLYQTEIFTPLTIRSDSILKEIMDKLDPLMLTDVDSDVKGDAFEYFLKESAATKNDLGEYFTPRHIVKTMVKLVNPQIGEKIYDPFCGTGGFLIESFRHIWNTMARNDDNKKKLKEETIYGNEITNTARITKMNMILAGDGHSNIHMQDSLANPVDGSKNDGYDIVITNMPYSQKTKYGPFYDLPTNNGDSICVQHCMKAINATAENGRMALVVPEGFLFRKDLAKTREVLLRNSNLQSVISLPQGVFLPYTGVKTDIVFATKVNQKLTVAEKRKDFWYFEVKNDGYSLDNHRRKLQSGSDLEKPQEYRKLDKLDDDQRQEMMDVGFEVIPFSKVKDNSYILVGNRYRSSVAARQKSTSTCPIISLGNEQYFSICSGGTPDTQNTSYWSGDVNWITLADLPSGNFVTNIFQTERTITKEGLSNSNAKVLPVGTVVVSSRATIGRIGVTRTELATNQGFKNIIIKDHKAFLPEYVAFVLCGQREEMLNMASGATFKEISKANFEKLQIPLYSLETQQQIVNELSGYQRIVDGARAVVESYRQVVRIGNKWNEVRLSDLFDMVGETIDPQKLEGNVNYIGLENIESDTGRLVGTIEADLQSIKSIKRNFIKGDILYGKLRPNLNKVYVATFDGVCSTDIIVLRSKRTDILPEFYAALLREKQLNSAVVNGVSGGQLPRVDLNYFFAMPMYEVDLSEQQKICDQFEAEKVLVEPSKQLIEMFSKKIQDRINEIWGE
jgi:type I restriction enzyme M protein